MKPVLEDWQPKLLLRAGEPWDITDKILSKSCKIINELVQKGEIIQEHAKKLSRNIAIPPVWATQKFIKIMSL